MKLRIWQWIWAFVSVVLGCLVGWVTVETAPDDAWVYEQYDSHVAGLSVVSLEMERYLSAANSGSKNTDTTPITQADVDARIAQEAVARDEMLAAFPKLRRAHFLHNALKWLALSAGLYWVMWVIVGITRSLQTGRETKPKTR